MHLPTTRIYNEMRSEEAGAWFVPAKGRDETAILIKAPTSSLKALISGAEMTIVLGIKDGFLCSGVRIFDIPGAPVLLCSVQRHLEEHEALYSISRKRSSPIFLYNEMDVCVAWSNCIIKEAYYDVFERFMTNLSQFYIGEMMPVSNNILDVFCHILDPNLDGNEKFETLEIKVTYSQWVSIKVSFAGVRDHHTISLDDTNEGSVLEMVTWASLESVFPLTICHSPQVRIGKNTRELTDVLASYQYGTFFIESKDLCVFQASIERSRERRLKGTQKQAHSAIKQLIGASKAAKRGELITDCQGNELKLILDKPLHCIVLLTELMHEGDWRKIEDALRDAMIETSDFFQIIDLRELIALLKASNGEPRLLDYNLIRRCEQFVKSGSVHIRSRLVK